MKVLTLFGTRPELIKLSEIIKKLDKYTDHVLVNTNQNYDPNLSDVFFKDLGVRPADYNLQIAQPTLGATLGGLMKRIETVLTDEKPDAVVILGDTNSALAGIIAKRMKIPLFHLEAGNRCFDDNVPEEINRRILDHISDVNMVYTQGQRLYLRDEGIAKDRLFIMGSPMQEIFNEHMIEVISSDVLDRLELDTEEYFLVSIHRDENVESEDKLSTLLDTLKEIANTYELPVIVSTHPRLKKKLKGVKLDPSIKFLPPFGFLDYNKLQMNAKCVISDSGTIAEESSILEFPAITIRNAIERAEAIDVGSILMTGVDKQNIMDCIKIVEAPTTVPADYDIDNCSDRVLKVILAYTGYVNRNVWHKWN